ncbi:MAG TPA: heme-binding protein [Candidatus Acidoferrales bacterium]|nr:heme-binding protein [Candidatus Acidoferrales bacterium]
MTRRGCTLRAWIFFVFSVGLVSCGGSPGARSDPDPSPAPQLEADEVNAIIESASRAVDRDMAIAVTDRRGVILGVAINFDFDYTATCAALACPTSDPPADCAVVDLAVQLARTAALFSADQTPLTSRSVRFLSGEHFPPGVRNTAAAALFGVENTNRGCAFDASEAGFEDAFPIPRAQSLEAVLRHGTANPLACENDGDRCGCTRGVATLPGGVPIYRNGRMVGGIGVALRGVALLPDPVAAFDQPKIVLRRSDQNPDFGVAEFAARAFAGDRVGFQTLAPKGLQPLCSSTTVTHPSCCAQGCDFNILPGRPPLPFDPVIFVGGVEIPEVSANPSVGQVGGGQPATNVILSPQGPSSSPPLAPASGWLLAPRDSPQVTGDLSKSEVEAIINAAIYEADTIRAAIRLPFEARTKMVMAISDTDGSLLGVYRMNDATVFSVDVAVAKSRNVVLFSSPLIDLSDTQDCPGPMDCRGSAYPIGTAITNRTLGFGAQPFFPSGIEGSLSGYPAPFAPGPFRELFLSDSARPCTNGLLSSGGGMSGRQNGIVFFPGSAPLYRAGQLIGGLGVSGDGVEQDDLVTEAGTKARSPDTQLTFEAPASIRADQFFVRGVRLPYLKFNRQPEQ